MEFENSLAYTGKDLKGAIETIADRMISSREAGEAKLRPFKKSEIWFDEPMLGKRHIDLEKLYPNAKVGDAAYVGTVLESVADYDALLTVVGNVCVFRDGEVLYDFEVERPEDRTAKIEMRVKKGENPIMFLVRCEEEGFGFSFMPSARRMGFMWAKDYLLHIRATIPCAEFCHEDGIAVSALCKAGDSFDGKFVYPTEACEVCGTVDFEKLYGNEAGQCAYALTYAEKDCILELDMKSDGKVFVNGEERGLGKIKLSAGDEVLVKSIRGEKWGFCFDESLPLGVSQLDSARSFGDKWLLVGSFGEGECSNIPFGPEIKLQFSAPYRTSEWKRCFWRLASCDDFVRVYMDTRFYSQWFYALMVGHFGLLSAAKALNSAEYAKYFVGSMGNIAKYFEYAKYDSEQFGQTTFLHRAIGLKDLDSIGSIGMNMCEYYKLSGDVAALECIDTLAAAAKNNIPRFDDMTYRRPRDMWADDVYMSCPFLIRLAEVKRDREYFAEAARQVLGFKKRLWMADKRIFSHIYFLDANEPNLVPWGRGNGWVLMTLSEICERFPEDMPQRGELVELFREFAAGVAALQDEDGLWHQVLTRKDSYKETSCTGMFAIAFIRGVRCGLLDESYLDRAKLAVDGLLKSKIDSTGNVFDVCMGSGNSRDAEYYIRLGAIDNDDHGTGIILTALSELLMLEN